MRFLIADTETTGLEVPIKICEVGWVEVDKNLDVLSEFEALVNPEVDITPGAAGKHGIRNEQVADEPVIEDLDFPKEEVCLICHNARFDRPLLEPHLNIVAQCCTLTLAKRMLPNCPDHKLETIAAYIDYPLTLAHRVLYDCRATLGLLEYLVEGSPMNLIQLINYSNVPERLEVMPWGRHEGKKFEDLPRGYLYWLKKLTDLDLDMELTLKYYR